MVYKTRNALRKKRPVGVRKVGRKRPYSNKPALAVRNYVQRAISRSEETKKVSLTYTLSSFNSGINSTADLIEVLPQLSQGLGQANRVGTKIRPIKLEITGYVVYLTDQIPDARMLGGRIFCYQDKAIRCYTDTNVNYNLLNLGGTSTNYTGTAMNWITPHNNDQYTFYADRKFTLMKPFGLTHTTVPAATTTMGSMDKSLFRPFKITLTQKHMPATLIFDQAESTVHPINFAPKLSFGYSDLLNFAADSLTLQLAMEFCATLYYKDA